MVNQMCETLDHFLLRCKKWAKARRKHLASVLEWRPEDVEDEAYAWLLCGSKEASNIDTIEYPDWLGLVPADRDGDMWGNSDGDDDDGDDDDVPLGNGVDLNEEEGGEFDAALTKGVEDRIPPFLKVAHFLQAVIPIRMRIVSTLLAPRADATLDGMVALAGPEGQAGVRQDSTVD
jgi:hypothetical protein